MLQRIPITIPSEDIQKDYYRLEEGGDTQKSLPPLSNLVFINTLYLSNTHLAHLSMANNSFYEKTIWSSSVLHYALSLFPCVLTAEIS